MSKNLNWTPQKVYQVSEQMQTAERLRAQDRALIDNQFNGGRPYTPDEVKTYQIHVNVNFLEGARRLSSAINQLNNALVFKERFFTAKSKKGDPEKKDNWSEVFTKNIHKPLKHGESGIRQMFLLKSRNASVALHGIGPIMWMKESRWRGRYIPLEDLLIPTDTLCDFSNLMFFAVNLYLTTAEFFDMTHGDETDSGWDMPTVEKIITELIKPDKIQGDQYFTLIDQPEKRAEWLKQNRYTWAYDAATTIKLRMFFYKDHDTKKWHRCVILREAVGQQAPDKQEKFLYDGSRTSFADQISHIMHVQFGDNSLVAPLKYNSVRGLGVMLYSAVELMNRVRCELAQHVLFNLKTLLKISNPNDRDRPKVLDWSQYSVVEDGVTMIPAQERYQIDSRLVESFQSQMKQLMGESSASYVKDIQAESSQPRTATETNVLSNEANVQVSAMLQSMYGQEEFYWQEEVRRFLDPHSEDPEVKEFQEQCRSDGIPDDLMVFDNWEIAVERVLGAGDQSMATQEASLLLSQRQWMDAPSQRIVERKWVTTISRDPKMGELLVPHNPNMATPGTIAAEDVFATLMLGIPATVRQGIDRTNYVESLIGMMGAKISQISQLDNMGTPQDVIGLQSVGQHIGQNIQILSQDPANKQKVKLYSDEIGKLMNLVKAFQQRQQQAAKAKQPAKESISINYSDAPPDIQRQMEQAAGFQPSQIPPEQADPKLAKAQQQMVLKEKQFNQKQHHQQISFALEQARKHAAASQDLSLDQLRQQHELINKNLTTAVDLHNKMQMQEAQTSTNGEKD